MTDPVQPTPAPGWYADPLDPAQQRYWTGSQWSAGTRPAAAQPAGLGNGAHAVDFEAPRPQLVPKQDITPPPAQPQPPVGWQGGGSAQQPGWDSQPQQPQPTAEPHLAPAMTGSTAQHARPLASFGARLLAMFLDGILLQILSWVVSYPFWRGDLARYQEWFRSGMDAAQANQPMPPVPTDLPSVSALLAQAGALAAITFLYSLLCLALAGRTLGMAICGIRVVDADDDGAKRVGWTTAMIRSALWTLLSVGASTFYFVTPLWLWSGLRVLWHPRRQSLPDQAAGTLVVSGRR